MKYGRLVFAKNNARLIKGQKINIGDYFQTFAVDALLEKAGAKPEEIINIERHDLRTYHSPAGPLRLPVCGMFGNVKGNEIFPLSKDIEPVFIGYGAFSKAYAKCPEWYQKAVTVGCRDEYTYRRMRQANIPAFISGCMTMTLPRRINTPKKNKVFFVDAPVSLNQYIPQSIRKDIEYVGQELLMGDEKDPMKLALQNERLARERFDRYIREASLVVTSRLHCAGPCMAMGIPVILAREYFDKRYAFLDKFLHFYRPEEFDRIDWEPGPVEMETEKALITEMAVAMLRGRPDAKLNRAVHEMYLSRERARINMPIKVKLYSAALAHAPKTADFMREHVLKRFSVATGVQPKEQPAIRLENKGLNQKNG